MDSTAITNVRNDIMKFKTEYNLPILLDYNENQYFDEYIKKEYEDIIVNQLYLNNYEKIVALIFYLKFNFIYNFGRKGLFKLLENCSIDDLFIELSIEDNKYKLADKIGCICRATKAINRGNYYRWFVIVEKSKNKMKVMEIQWLVFNYDNKAIFKYVVKDDDLMMEIKKHKKMDMYVLANDIKKRNMHKINQVIFSY